ncbi:MAG TPA: hypothetical protein VGK59_01545 [Ohtaekwangia sp.]
MKKITCIILLTLAFTTLFGQAKTRRLPSIINHPSLDLYAPYISMDGNALLFVSNSGQDGELTVSYTTRESDWITPVDVPKYLNTRLNFMKGYALSADGKKIYVTGAKTPVIGGYDIFVSELKGSSWTQPENLLLPINSKANDGCPSLTPDEKALYFMRCDKMDQNKASGCKLFVSQKKPNGQWGEPAELPAAINTGNSQTPRIMADGETLIFSSDKMGTTKGGMDLYVSKFSNGTWTEPIALDFVNTEKDDQFVSVAALGRYLLKESPGQKKNSELTEFLIPTEIKPQGMMKVEGKITDPAGAAVPAYIAAWDLKTNTRFYNGRPAADGTYFFYLREGTKYELSFDPEQSNVSYISRQLDLTSDKIPQKEKVNVILKPVAIGDELSLDLLKFKPYSNDLDEKSDTEIKRLARVIKANPTLKFEIQVMLSGYVEDSVKSDNDLTEMLVDSITMKYDDIDTLGQLYQRDTIVARVRYHNDRTAKQADAIIRALVAQGADPSKLKYFVNAIPATSPENRKLTIKAVARKG